MAKLEELTTAFGDLKNTVAAEKAQVLEVVGKLNTKIDLLTAQIQTGDNPAADALLADIKATTQEISDIVTPAPEETPA